MEIIKGSVVEGGGKHNKTIYLIHGNISRSGGGWVEETNDFKKDHTTKPNVT